MPERKEAHKGEGTAKHSSHSSGSKAPTSVPSSGLTECEGKPVRERREKDREPAQGSDRESGQAKDRGTITAGAKSRLAPQDMKAVMPSEKPAQTPAQDGQHEADQHRDARHRDSARKARAAAPPVPSKAEAAVKPAAELDATKRKPGVELDDLRERALSSRRPAAKQEAPAAAAGVPFAMYMPQSVVMPSNRMCSMHGLLQSLQMLCPCSSQALACQRKRKWCDKVLFVYRREGGS